MIKKKQKKKESGGRKKGRRKGKGRKKRAGHGCAQLLSRIPRLRLEDHMFKSSQGCGAESKPRETDGVCVCGGGVLWSEKLGKVCKLLLSSSPGATDINMRAHWKSHNGESWGGGRLMYFQPPDSPN